MEGQKDMDRASIGKKHWLPTMRRPHVVGLLYVGN